MENKIDFKWVKIDSNTPPKFGKQLVVLGRDTKSVRTPDGKNYSHSIFVPITSFCELDSITREGCSFYPEPDFIPLYYAEYTLTLPKDILGEIVNTDFV